MSLIAMYIPIQREDYTNTLVIDAYLKADQ